MRWFAIAMFVYCACATTQPHPLPEQMPQGRVICRAMCSSVGRDYQEYRYDGKCVCR